MTELAAPPDPVKVAELETLIVAVQTAAARLYPSVAFAARLHSTCAWCSVPIARGTGKHTWWHTEPLAASPYVHAAEPTETTPPYVPEPT